MRTMLVAIDGSDVALRALEHAASVTGAILDDARARLAGHIANFEIELLEGDPGETIARRAGELGCESIVMGTHGRGRLGSALMGSVAQRVVHDASVPVTLVK